MTEDQIRQLFVDAWVAVAGLSAEPASLEAYLDVIAPCAADRANPARCAQLAAMSSCALVVRGLWARLGVQHEILSSPYRDRQAVTDLVRIARGVKALYSAHRRPLPGDSVIIESPEHVLTVVGWRADVVLCSVDGGQRDDRRLEEIERKERHYDAGAMRLDGRPIFNVIDCVAIYSLVAGTAVAA